MDGEDEDDSFEDVEGDDNYPIDDIACERYPQMNNRKNKKPPPPEHICGEKW